MLVNKKISKIMKKHYNPPNKLKINIKKLKTLKDFTECEYHTGIELATKLRKEAIKWVNFIRKDVKEMHYDEGDKEGAWYHEGQIDWIELFFNIKEEDLKDDT